MSFFQSEIVRGDIQEMLELQQFCFRSAMNFILLENERKLEYFDALETLIQKQQVFYARAKLSDDPESQVCRRDDEARDHYARCHTRHQHRGDVSATP